MVQQACPTVSRGPRFRSPDPAHFLRAPPTHHKAPPHSRKPRPPQFTKPGSAGAGRPCTQRCLAPGQVLPPSLPRAGPLCHALRTAEGPGSAPVVWEELAVLYSLEFQSPLETQSRPVKGDSPQFPRKKAHQKAGARGQPPSC